MGLGSSSTAPVSKSTIRNFFAKAIWGATRFPVFVGIATFILYSLLNFKIEPYKEKLLV
jgi:hypothetical protein